MIKTIAKVFAFTSIFKNLVLTQKSKTEGITQLHPIKIPGRTVFVREKEYFIRENIVEGTIPIVFLHSWGTDSLGSWFNVLPKIKNVSSFITIDFKNHGTKPLYYEEQTNNSIPLKSSLYKPKNKEVKNKKTLLVSIIILGVLLIAFGVNMVLNNQKSKQNKFIKDIWIYGSYKDEISDLDLIVVYNNSLMVLFI